MPSCFLVVSVRTRQQHQSAYWAPRGPDLLAVDQPVVALVLALGLQRGEVGAGARLGKALAPAQVAAARSAGGASASAPRCRIRAGSGRTWSRPCRRSGCRRRCGPFPAAAPAPRPAREAAAAVWLRPGRRAPALLAHALAPELGVAGLVAAAALHLVGPAWARLFGKLASSQARASARKASRSRSRSRPWRSSPSSSLSRCA